MKHIDLVRATLLKNGSISGYDAIYTQIDPETGEPHRNTRLAATIFNLRHREGMAIETRQEKGRLATYVLIRRPDPKPDPVKAWANPAPVSPLRAEAKPSSVPEWRCPGVKSRSGVVTPCNSTLEDVHPLPFDDRWAEGRCLYHGRVKARSAFR